MKLLLISSGLIAGLAILLVSCGVTRLGYESAPYKVKTTYTGFELREYPALTVAATGSAGTAGRDERFMRLFRYISGANEGRQKISMTTPVFMDQAEERQEMMFVLPASAATKAPAPDASAVNVKTLPARKMAVLRYSGSDSREHEKAKEKELRTMMEAAGLRAAGDALFAYYDPPWTPGFARRNEVLVPVN
jgi:DNA gyrase inhibitor GyrI